MEGRRKAPLKTYGRSTAAAGGDAQPTRSKPDSFDMLFGHKKSRDDSSLVPAISSGGVDPFSFDDDELGSPTSKAPPSKQAKQNDPFDFSKEDDAISKTTQKTKKIAAKSTGATKPGKSTLPASKTRANSTNQIVGSPPHLSLFGDNDQGNTHDKQLKIDAFTVALPRLKVVPKPKSTELSSQSAPSNEFRGHRSLEKESSEVPNPMQGKSKISEPEPVSAISVASSVFEFDDKIPEKIVKIPSPTKTSPIDVQKPALVPQRQIFTTGRQERKKIANPKSWFADEDEEEDLSEKVDLAPASLLTKQKSSTSVSSIEQQRPKRHGSGSSDNSNPSSSKHSSVLTVIDSATGKRSVRVARSDKDKYAVIKHVRGVNELQAEGSSLEYDGDYNYLIECLGSGSQLSSRCLSAFQLASKCADTSDFRLYLKSTGKLGEVFEKLNDANEHDLLALCAAAIFLVLSSDRSQVDLDTRSLSLLVKFVKLSKTDSWSSTVPAQIQERVKTGISGILKQLLRKYGSDFGSFSSSVETPAVIQDMALSALHTLCQRCSSASSQNEFRESGALEILVVDCSKCLENPDMTPDGVQGYSKRLKHLISGVQKLIAKNKEAKQTAAECNGSRLPRALAKFSCSLLPDTIAWQRMTVERRYQVPENESRLLSQTYNLLMTLCCDTKSTCSILASEYPDFLAASARLALIGSTSVEAVHEHFDLSILAFYVLVNIFEYSPVAAAVSHPHGSDGPSLVSLMIDYFTFLCSAADDCERETDEQISSSQQQQKVSSGSNLDDTIRTRQRPSSSIGPSLAGDDSALDAMIEAAGTRHMELNFLAACCCIIVGTAMDCEAKGVESIRKQFKDQNFNQVVDVLKRFLTFTALVNGADDRSLETVAKILEKYDAANRAAGFGAATQSSSLTTLPSSVQAASSSTSQVAASSSLNWATPPHDDSSMDEADQTMQRSKKDGSNTSIFSRFRNIRSEKASFSTTAVNGEKLSPKAADGDDSD